jgi:chemotaxis regulatin CheY-phosphate phosphatase CheZ
MKFVGVQLLSTMSTFFNSKMNFLEIELRKKFPREIHSSLKEFGKTIKTKHHITDSLKKSYIEDQDYIEIRKGNCRYYHVTNSCYNELLNKMSKRDQKEFRIRNNLIKEENLRVIEPEEIKEIISVENFEKLVKWVDIFTDEELIEIKRADEWKDAIGQVLATRVFLKELNPRIHLFTILYDKKTKMYKREESKQMVETVCKELDIKVTWYDLLTDE